MFKTIKKFLFNTKTAITGAAAFAVALVGVLVWRRHGA